MNNSLFNNFPSLNTFLRSEIDTLKNLGKAECSDKLKTITKTIVESVKGWIAEKHTKFPKGASGFLKLASEIRAHVIEVGKGGKAARSDLSKAIRIFAGQYPILEPNLHQMKKLKHYSKKIYLKTLASLIAEKQLPIHTLKLTDAQIKELAPYLTYLRITFDKLSEEALRILLNDCVKVTTFRVQSIDEFSPIWAEGVKLPSVKHLEFSDCNSAVLPFPEDLSQLRRLSISGCLCFQGELPTKMSSLSVLTIVGCPMFCQPLPLDMEALDYFRFVNRSSSQTHLFLQFLKAIYEKNREQALKFAEAERWSEKELLLYFSFLPEDPEETQVILDLIEQITVEKLDDLITKNNIPYVKESWCHPIWKLKIYCLHSLVGDDSYGDLKKYMDAKLFDAEKEILCFPEVIDELMDIGVHIPNFGEVIQTVLNSPLERNSETLANLGYLQFVKADYQELQKNLKAAFSSIGAENTLRALPPNPVSVEMLSHPQFFSGKKKHDMPLMRCLKNLNKNGLVVFLTNRDKYIKFMQDHPALKIYIKGLIGTEEGRKVIKEEVSHFLNCLPLQQMIAEVYPPEKSENLSLYPLMITPGRGRHYLTYMRGVAQIAPDGILRHLGVCSNLRKLKVRQYGSTAVDQGGPGNEFFTELMSGIVAKSRTICFEQCDDGKLIPLPKTGMSAELKEIFKTFGTLLGIAIRSDFQIGDYFSLKFFQGLMSFTIENLHNPDFSGLAFLQSMDDAALVLYMDVCTKPNAAASSFKEVLLSDNSDTVKEKAQYLNDIWMDDDLTDALERGDCAAIKKCVRSSRVNDYSGYVDVVHAIAKGMSQQLPWEIDRVEVKTWQAVRGLPVEKLALQLQGQLTPEWIMSNIVTEPENNAKAEQLKQWIVDWIKAHSEDPSALKHFLLTVTGAPALTGKIVFKLTDNPDVKGPTAQTCSRTIAVPMDIDQESFLLTLDAWGRGENCGFNVL